jgi:hypothetical protein
MFKALILTLVAAAVYFLLKAIWEYEMRVANTK